MDKGTSNFLFGSTKKVSILILEVQQNKQINMSVVSKKLCNLQVKT